MQLSILAKFRNKLHQALSKEKSPYINSDGTFVGGFDGCVQHFTNEKGLSEEGAKRMCAYIGRQAGKIV